MTIFVEETLQEKDKANNISQNSLQTYDGITAFHSESAKIR